MTFLRKHLLLVVSLLLVVACLGPYLFLVRPVMVRRQEVIKATEEKLAQLRRYRDDPPSPEMVDRLGQEKEMLENQYEEVIKILNFAQPVPLPEDPGDPLFLDEQIERFERQIEKAKDELGRLAERTGINIPERLGFREERPESREELSILLSQLLLARELVTLVIETGVSELFLLNPLHPLLLEEVRPEEVEVHRPVPPRPPGDMLDVPPEMLEMMLMFPMEIGPGIPDRRQRDFLVEEDKFAQVLGLEKLEFELGVRAEMSALTNLLHQIANHSYFFAVQDLEIRSVRARRERALPEVRERDRRRRRRVPQRREMPPWMEGMPPWMEEMPPEMMGLPPWEMELPLRVEPEEVEGELEVRLLVATHLSPPPSEEK